MLRLLHALGTHGTDAEPGGQSPSPSVDQSTPPAAGRPGACSRARPHPAPGLRRPPSLRLNHRVSPSQACPGLEKSLKLIERWELTHHVQLNRAANSAVRVPSSHGGSRRFESRAAQWTYGECVRFRCTLSDVSHILARGYTH